MATKGWISLVT